MSPGLVLNARSMGQRGRYGKKDRYRGPVPAVGRYDAPTAGLRRKARKRPLRGAPSESADASLDCGEWTLLAELAHSPDQTRRAIMSAIQLTFRYVDLIRSKSHQIYTISIS